MSTTGAESYIIGDSPCARELREQCVLYAPYRIIVLIVGESGTGKGVVANELHRLSPRNASPLIPISCGDLSPELIRSELAGAVKGGATSVDRDRPGLLSVREPRNAFLNDLQCLAREAQPKMLDCLEDRGLRAVGAPVGFQPDIRWFIGSQLTPAQLVQKELLRADLKARIEQAVIMLEPLRTHLSDVLLLAPHLLSRLARVERLDTPGITCRAMEALLAYDWPNNVRQLEAALHVALCRVASRDGREILVEDLPDLVRNHNGRDKEKRFVDADTLRRALERHRWVITSVARDLGVDRRTVHRKVHELGIERPG